MSPIKWNKHFALSSTYQTPQMIGKAIKKATQSLSSSPRKKQYIVKCLAKEVGRQ